MKKETPKLGDFIVTNENFFPSENGYPIEMSGVPGVIVRVEDDKYLCRFGQGHAWTLNVDNLFSDDYGCILTEDEFDIDN